MKALRIEARNGYEIRLRTIHVRHGHRAACKGEPGAGGYVAFVQVARDGEVFVNWHLPRSGRHRPSREEAESDALEYAVRLVDRRPFGGPPTTVSQRPAAAWRA